MVRQLLGTSGRTLPVRKDKGRQVVAGASKNALITVIRRFNASSAGLKSSWGWTYAGKPLNAISRSSNWEPRVSRSESLLERSLAEGGSWFPRGTGLQLMQSTIQP
jgi:hypothetical protein